METLRALHKKSRPAGCLAAILALFPVRAADFVPDPALSKVEVAVRATADNFTATLDQFAASIQVDAQGRPTSGAFSWNFKDLHTGSTRRDKEMLHWLEHDKMPDATFTFGKLSTNQSTLLAIGRLQMHGMTNQLAVPLSVTRHGQNLAWEGDLELDHRPYHLQKIVKLGILRVDPLLKVHFKLEGPVKD